MLDVCQMVGHRLVMPLLLRPQLVMHWLVMHVLAKDSPGWPGDVSVTNLPCVHAIYMEDHHRQTKDRCKKLMVSVCIYIRMQTFCNRKLYNVQRNAIIICTKESSMCTKTSKDVTV